ncbi:conserved hypothetical protein [Anaeromyxobacter dehalogenans 2CP-1]|uniref:Lipoprotein n=1 Tax=Anaeromyxobacter dehalogenans (strain ATCC BAA-258 / DSM 21875 / 2CP-1) TaxID=455488 RepID=B8JA90_ANAD2|nr:hypothetical protein [Anaeromyxobacter dehalogenans]ACL65609.1 conserved hypothetical protein [Anaeromyxobacter dehalogenans 2CP-1]
MPSRWLLPLCVAAALSCAGPGARAPAPPPAGLDEAAAREVLRRFADALRQERWPDAHALLSARWQGAYTPARLATDAGGAGPAGREAAERVRALLGQGASLRDVGGARVLDVGGGRRAVLVAEGGRWRVDALE